MDLIYDINFNKKEINDRIEMYSEKDLRNIEAAFVFDDISNKLNKFAVNYVAKNVNSEEPTEFLKYDNRKKSKLGESIGQSISPFPCFPSFPSFSPVLALKIGFTVSSPSTDCSLPLFN